MKKSIVITLATFFAANLSAQNSLTNTIPEFLLRSSPWQNRYLMTEIAETFKARINTEINYKNILADIKEIYSSDGIKTKEQQKHDRPGMMKFAVTPEMAFTNATLEEVLGTFVENIPNYIWRYDCENDITYVQPVTNSISMTRIGSVSITNGTFFEVGKILYKNNLDYLPSLISYKVNGNARRFSEDELSLEFEDAYLYEILDAVVAQIPDASSWTIMGKRIYLHSKNVDQL